MWIKDLAQSSLTTQAPIPVNNDTSKLIDDNASTDLQAAAAMDARLQFILDNISTKFFTGC